MDYEQGMACSSTFCHYTTSPNTAIDKEATMGQICHQDVVVVTAAKTQKTCLSYLAVNKYSSAPLCGNERTNKKGANQTANREHCCGDSV